MPTDHWTGKRKMILTWRVTDFMDLTVQNLLKKFIDTDFDRLTERFHQFKVNALHNIFQMLNKASTFMNNLNHAYANTNINELTQIISYNRIMTSDPSKDNTTRMTSETMEIPVLNPPLKRWNLNYYPGELNKHNSPQNDDICETLGWINDDLPPGSPKVPEHPDSTKLGDENNPTDIFSLSIENLLPKGVQTVCTKDSPDESFINQDCVDDVQHQVEQGTDVTSGICKHDTLLITDKLERLTIKKSKRRRLTDITSFPQTATQTQDNFKFNTSNTNILIPVDISAGREAFRAGWKRSLQEAGIDLKPRKKKPKILSEDQRAKQLTSLVGKNVSNQTGYIGNLLNEIKPGFETRVNNSPLWHEHYSSRQKNQYTVKMVPIQKLEVLKLSTDMETDFVVKFGTHKGLTNRYKRGSRIYLNVGSVTYLTSRALLNYATTHRIPIRNAPNSNSAYTATDILNECRMDIPTMGMNFIDFARYSNFIVMMGHFFANTDTPFFCSNQSDDKVRKHVENFIKKMNNFLMNWDTIKCPTKFLKEIKKLANIRGFNLSDLIIKDKPLEPKELLRSSLGQIGVVSMEQQVIIESALHRKLQNNPTHRAYTIVAGSVQQFFDRNNNPNPTNELAWGANNPIWIKFCNLMGTKILKVDDQRIGGGKVEIIRNINDLIDYDANNNHLTPTWGPQPSPNDTISDTDKGIIDELAIAVSYSDASSLKSARNANIKLTYRIIDNNEWTKDPNRLFVPCKWFFGKMGTKTNKDKDPSPSQNRAPIYSKELKELHERIIKVKNSIDTICKNSDYSNKIHTRAKFILPAEDIFQGCVVGLLSPEYLIFAIHNLGVLTPNVYQDNDIYSSYSVTFKDNKSSIVLKDVDTDFKQRLEELKMITCTSPWFEKTEEIWERFIIMATQPNIRCFLNFFSKIMNESVRNATKQQSASLGCNDVLNVKEFMDKIMRAVGSCTEITETILNELAIPMTVNQKVLLAELFRMSRTVYLGNTVIDGNKYIFGLESNVLAKNIYRKNTESIREVARQAIDPFLIAKMIIHAKKLVDDAIRTRIVTSTSALTGETKTRGQYLRSWIGTLQDRKRLITNYLWPANSARFAEFLHTIAEETTNQLPEGTLPKRLNKENEYTSRTICHGFLSASQVRIQNYSTLKSKQRWTTPKLERPNDKKLFLGERQNSEMQHKDDFTSMETTPRGKKPKKNQKKKAKTNLKATTRNTRWNEYIESTTLPQTRITGTNPRNDRILSPTTEISLPDLDTETRQKTPKRPKQTLLTSRPTLKKIEKLYSFNRCKKLLENIIRGSKPETVRKMPTWKQISIMNPDRLNEESISLIMSYWLALMSDPIREIKRPKMFSVRQLELVKEHETSGMDARMIYPLPPNLTFIRNLVPLMNTSNWSNNNDENMGKVYKVHSMLSRRWHRETHPFVVSANRLVINKNSTLVEVVKDTFDLWKKTDNKFYITCRLCPTEPNRSRCLRKWEVLDPTTFLVTGSSSLLHDDVKKSKWAAISLSHLVIPEKIYKPGDSPNDFTKTLKGVRRLEGASSCLT